LPETWGGVAKRAARRLAAGDPFARDYQREPRVADPDAPVYPSFAREPYEYARDEDPAPAPRRRKKAEGTPLSIDRDALVRGVGEQRAERLERRLREAARAYESEQYDEALPVLRRLAQELPRNADVRELLGLVHYRTGRWGDAIKDLEAYALLAQSKNQHPVLADCYRAQRRWDEVDRLWEELREASPSAEAVSEGRIVAAGALADQGRLPDALAVLSHGFRMPARPKPFHLRRMYALADLYERAGDLPKARALFERVAATDPDFFDVTDRVRHLA
jgi:tetratricopeptide (TPR) repeat protein